MIASSGTNISDTIDHVPDIRTARLVPPALPWRGVAAGLPQEIVGTGQPMVVPHPLPARDQEMLLPDIVIIGRTLFPDAARALPRPVLHPGGTTVPA